MRQQRFTIESKLLGVQAVMPVGDAVSFTVEVDQTTSKWTDGKVALKRANSPNGPWRDWIPAQPLLGPGPDMSPPIDPAGVAYLGIGMSVVSTTEQFVDVLVTVNDP